MDHVFFSYIFPVDTMIGAKPFWKKTSSTPVSHFLYPYSYQYVLVSWFEK